MDETTPTAPATAPVADSSADTDLAVLVDEELLVEEISIDGMCGVY
jgi:mycofactocin precursor